MGSPSASTYAYPWDVFDIGVEDAFAELQDAGVVALDLATAYHPIATFSPRAGARRMLYQEQGAVFFPARTERYGRIKPSVWPDAELMTAWPKAAETAQRYGIALRGWTIGMFQPWIAHHYPDCARVMATGAVVPAGACPGSPDVQEYIATLVTDAASQFDLSGIRLEKISFPGYDYGWVRPRVLLNLGAWTKWLLSVCFCPSCTRQGEEAGVAVGALRQRIVTEVQADFDGVSGSQDRAARHQEWLADDADYAEYIRLRDASVVKLLATVASSLSGTGRHVPLGVYYDPDEVDFAKCAEHIDAITMGYFTSAEDAKKNRQLADAENLQLDYLLYISDTRTPDSAEINEKVQAFAGLPVDEIGIYNFGLLRKSYIPALADKIRKAGS